VQSVPRGSRNSNGAPKPRDPEDCERPDEPPIARTILAAQEEANPNSTREHLVVQLEGRRDQPAVQTAKPEVLHDDGAELGAQPQPRENKNVHVARGTLRSQVGRPATGLELRPPPTLNCLYASLSSGTDVERELSEF
jgi:hypothetical protein